MITQQKPSTIQLEISGGIGNQLFQWAYGHHLHLQGYKIIYDISFYAELKNKPYITKRNFLLPDFIKSEIDTNNLVSFDNEIKDTRNYVEHKFKPNKSYKLTGWWQSEKYFLTSRDNILSSIQSYTTDDYKQYNFTDSCSVHVRRGDYASKYRGLYPLMSLDYYKRALDYIKPKGNIFIFSDSINWCRGKFNYDNVVYVKSNNALTDLKMMSLCTDNITANSSYSWWGSWLNKNPNKKIVMPNKIFKDGRPFKDYYITGCTKFNI